MTFLGKTNSAVIQQFCEKKWPNYLKFTAIDGDVLLKLKKFEDPEPVDLEISFDRENWEMLDQTSGKRISTGQTLYVRRTDDNSSNTFSKDISRYYQFQFVSSNGFTVKLAGNIQYLLGKSGNRTDVPDNCYVALFSYDSNPQHHYICDLEFPGVSLGSNCYKYMFYQMYDLAGECVLNSSRFTGSSDDPHYRMFAQTKISKLTFPNLTVQQIIDGYKGNHMVQSLDDNRVDCHCSDGRIELYDKEDPS